MSNKQNIIKVQFVVILALLFFIVWQFLNQPADTIRIESAQQSIPYEQAPLVVSFSRVTPSEGEVVVPISELNSFRAKFFSLQEGIQFFLIRSSEDSIIAGFNACRTCYAQRKGYSQSGDALVCNSCNDTTYFQEIGATAKECSPVQLTARIEGRSVHIREKDLRSGAPYFSFDPME